MSFLQLCLKAALLSLSLSLDAFAAAFSSGTCQIRIPALSVWIISVTCSILTGAGILLGLLFSGIIPPHLMQWIGFATLFFLGIIKFFDKQTPDHADKDHSKRISPKEAFGLAVAVSMDGLAAGFGSMLTLSALLPVLFFSLLFGITAVSLGARRGWKISGSLPVRPGLISGVLFLILAVCSLL